MAQARTEFSPLQKRPCGVVVTYHPDGGVCDRIRAMRAECGRLLVVDNGSGDETASLIAGLQGITLLRLPQNLGIAAALNRGAAWALAQGEEWIVTFDQDSIPHSGMAAALMATAARFPTAAIVGPRIVDTVPGSAPYRWVCRSAHWPFMFTRVPCENEDLPAVTSVITSGSMISLSAWQTVGRFDESLFIDYVDNDFCLRVITAGYRICVSHLAFLDHQLGTRTRHSAMGHDFRPTHHSPLRHYFMSRNRVVMWRRHAVRYPHWAFFDAAFAAYNYFRVAVFESERLRKFKAMVLGTWDGLCGAMGPCPERRKRVLEGSG